MKRYLVSATFALAVLLPSPVFPQLSQRQADIASIASYTAVGELDSLYNSLNSSLDNGMTVNEVKEVLVHTYAYCGFPRSLQGLKTLVKVIDDRKDKGIADNWGRESTSVNPSRDRYARGREILSEISGVSAEAPKADYAVLAPEIEVFLKEHLFSDLFERDAISYADRELATIAVIASLGDGVEPMLKSHSMIAMRLGVTQPQIEEIKALAAKNRMEKNMLFPKGAEINTATFDGKAWLSRLMTDMENFDVVVSDVIFDPEAHNDWHKHPGGQILIATSGKGYYQERGNPVQVLNPGDVVAIKPGVEHWHGAAPDSNFSHIAINTRTALGATQWLEKVDENDYNNK